MAAGIVLASNTQTSSLSAIFVASLLTSPKLPALIALNSKRLGCNYQILVSFLKRHKVSYIPSYAGLFVFAKMAGEAKSWDDEQITMGRLKEVGVLVSAGRGYHGPEKEMGWMRVGFAVEKSRLEKALRRMEAIYMESDGETVMIDDKMNGTPA